MMGNGFGMGGMWAFWLFGLLLLIGVVLLVVLAVRAAGGGIDRNIDVRPPSAGERHRPHSHAREILDERYARGELTTEEYRERLHTIGQDE